MQQPHAFGGEIRAALQRAPPISLIEETVQAVRRQHADVGRVGLLVAACLNARLYQGAFAAAGLKVVEPQAELRARLMALLYPIKAGEIGPEAGSEMTAIAETLVAGGAKLIVSGCTDVPLVLVPADLSHPMVDSTYVLVDAALAFARRG